MTKHKRVSKLRDDDKGRKKQDSIEGKRISASLSKVRKETTKETGELHRVQAALLSGVPIQSVQQANLAERISQELGNQHLQRLVLVQKDDEKDDHTKHEAKVKELVAAGKHKEAVQYICDTYGFTGYNFEFKVVEKDELPGAWATTSGEIKKGAKQTLKIRKDLFTKTFPFIVRTIGHEFQHVIQRSGETPVTNQPEREFLAWAWEALDTSVPGYPLEMAAYHAKKALEYFDRMPDGQQKKYAKKKKDLEALIEKAKKEKEVKVGK